MRNARSCFFTGLALSLTGLLLATPAFSSNKARIAIECPSVLATTVVARKYKGWFIYSNDPLRLTGADIAYLVDHEDATLDPDETRELKDESESVVQIFRLKQHREAEKPELVCHYGIHAQLSRTIPPRAVECEVIHYRIPRQEEIDFEASCQ
jgi:hypothetical protein